MERKFELLAFLSCPELGVSTADCVTMSSARIFLGGKDFKNEKENGKATKQWINNMIPLADLIEGEHYTLYDNGKKGILTPSGLARIANKSIGAEPKLFKTELLAFARKKTLEVQLKNSSREIQEGVSALSNENKELKRTVVYLDSRVNELTEQVEDYKQKAITVVQLENNNQAMTIEEVMQTCAQIGDLQVKAGRNEIYRACYDMKICRKQGNNTVLTSKWRRLFGAVTGTNKKNGEALRMSTRVVWSKKLDERIKEEIEDDFKRYAYLYVGEYKNDASYEEEISSVIRRYNNFKKKKSAEALGLANLNEKPKALIASKRKKR